MWYRLGCFCLLLIIAGPGRTENTNEAMVVTYSVVEDYSWVRQNLEAAITNQGLVISGVLHIADMLTRTGPDLGYQDDVYLQGESLEFCSADITQKMTRLDPRNIGICPFTVAVYVTAAEPERVYVAYRRSRLLGAASQIEQSADELLDTIAREAVE